MKGLPAFDDLDMKQPEPGLFGTRALLLCLQLFLRGFQLALQPRLHLLVLRQFSLQFNAPLANRLGISWVKSELEDLAFAALEPAVYAEMERQVARHTKERGQYIGEVREKLEATLK